MSETPQTAPTPPRAPQPRKPLPFYKALKVAVPAGRDEWPAEAFWYTALIAGCAAAGLMLWGVYSALPRGANPEKLLRAEHIVPKLKGEMRTEAPVQVATAEPPLLPPPPAPEPARPDPVKADLAAFPVVPVPLPVVPAPAKLAPPPAPELVRIDLPKIDLPPTIAPAQAVIPALPLHQDPLVFVSRGHLGDTPMLRSWKTLTLYSLVALAPVTLPAPVAAQDDPKLTKRLDDLERLINKAITSIDGASKGIDGVRIDLGGLRKETLLLRTDMDGAALRVDNLEKIVGNLQADIKFLRQRANEPSSPAPVDRANLEELKKHLVSIEQAILRLRGPEAPSNRIALSPPAPAGKIILANMYHEELLFVINQRTHRVGPGIILPIENVPAALQYEVISPTWGLRARSERNLPANETFTLTAR